jgi:histidinol dehydrogenase
VIYLANAEGLTAHAASVELRANEKGPEARPKPKPEKVAAAASKK